MNSENKIYIHADDYGYTKSMSSKILDCVNDGKVNSISIMIDGNSEACLLYTSDAADEV